MITRIASEMREHPSRWALGLLLVLMLAPVVFPSLDFAPSAWFYIPGAGFTWSADGFLEFVRAWVPDIIVGSFVVCVVLWIAGLWREQWPWRISTPRIVYLLLTLLIGPGLIVEALLKTEWGRARPKDIVMFGGEAAYTAPWQIAHECARNCSFASGHAALAFWVTAYAFLLPPKWRATGLFAGVVFGLAVGLVRIVQGAHFLSDVAAAGFVVLLVNAALTRLILNRPALNRPVRNAAGA